MEIIQMVLHTNRNGNHPNGLLHGSKDRAKRDNYQSSTSPADQAPIGSPAEKKALWLEMLACKKVMLSQVV